MAMRPSRQVWQHIIWRSYAEMGQVQSVTRIRLLLNAMQFPKLLFVAALLLSSSAKADVLVVGPTQAFTDIQAAVDAAASGDLLLIQAGEYSSFKVDGKGLSILADGPGAALVKGTVQVRNLPGHQIFVMRGLSVDAKQAERLNEAFFAAKCDGVLWIESCRFTGDDGEATKDFFDVAGRDGAKLISSRASVWNRCSFNGGEGASSSDDDAQPFIGSAGHGLNLDRGTHSVYNCNAAGNDGGSDFDEDGQSAGNAGNGMEAQGVLFVSGCELSGGKGGFADCDPFAGCGAGGDGGSGINLLNNSKATTLSNQYSPGQGGSGGSSFGNSAPDGQDGENVKLGFDAKLQAISGAARQLKVPSPLRFQEAGSMDVVGKAGDIVFVQVSLDARHQSSASALGPLFPVPPTRTLFLGSIPPGGELSFPFAVQSGFGTGPHTQFFLQALVLNQNGVTFASNPTELTLLDPAF